MYKLMYVFVYTTHAIEIC